MTLILSQVPVMKLLLTLVTVACTKVFPVFRRKQGQVPCVTPSGMVSCRTHTSFGLIVKGTCKKKSRMVKNTVLDQIIALYVPYPAFLHWPTAEA